MLAGESPIGFREELTPAQRKGEILAFRIRMADGIPSEELAPWEKEIAHFEAIGLLEPRATHHRLTRRGKLLADRIAEIFVESPST